LFLTSSQLWRFAKSGVTSGHNVAGGLGKLSREVQRHKTFLVGALCHAALWSDGEEFAPILTLRVAYFPSFVKRGKCQPECRVVS
jgi:hypothetical protein